MGGVITAKERRDRNKDLTHHTEPLCPISWDRKLVKTTVSGSLWSMPLTNKLQPLVGLIPFKKESSM